MTTRVDIPTYVATGIAEGDLPRYPCAWLKDVDGDLDNQDADVAIDVDYMGPSVTFYFAEHAFSIRMRHLLEAMAEAAEE